mmetsp:Transcript_86396/g.247922  ORF Transcript_86396/g.247922 Transcript_86396/m.247922 type:complete len:235 (+) Transcript_86396:978-1682(+)
MRKHLRAVLLRERQALGPIALAGVHVQGAVHVASPADEFVAVALVDQVALVPVFHDADHVRALLLGQQPRLLPNLAGDVAIHGLLRGLDALVELGCRLEALDGLQALSHDRDDVVVPLLRMLHGQAHGVLPDLLQPVWVRGGRLVDGEVGVDGARVVAGLLVDLRSIQHLLQALAGGARAALAAVAVGVHDVSEHLRAMLLAHANRLVDHALRGVGLHRQLRLAGLNEQGLGLL